MKSPLIFAWFLGLALAIAGCGGGGAVTPSPGGPVGPDNQPPVLSNVALSATTLDFHGGSVTISANVTDASGVANVTATIAKGGVVIGTVALSSAGGTTYSGTFSLPANQNATAASDVYTVTLRATDVNGNTSADVSAGSITVTAPDALGDQVPPPPVWPS